MTYVAESCGGELLSGATAAQIRRVCADSREAQPGDLFVALAGEHFDGHDFLKDVFQKGAAAALIQKSKSSAAPTGKPLIVVNDTRRALGQFAARYRLDFALPMVAVGGSNGKTTVKELIAAALGQKWNTLRSPASFNNDIGVPLTLLQLERTHQAAVLEVGTNHPGELAPLVRMVQPRHGVVTSLGGEHLEFFGDLAGVAEEEGWLAELLPADGRLFVNGDSPAMNRIIRRTRASLVRVGQQAGCDWRGHDVRVDESGTTFWVDAPEREFSGEYRVRLLGKHQVTNAILAIAVGRELGLGRADITRGLAECRPAKMRLQLSNIDDVRVLDDAYNANVDSMRAALQTLRELPCRGRRIAILGDMAELGETSRAAHAEVGRHAAETGVDELVAIGKMAAVMEEAARAAGLKNTRSFAAVEAAAGPVRESVTAGDLVLVKASRSSRFERMVDVLRSNAPVVLAPAAKG
ncbi:MAG: UDP-N-acetylmuramoyl-tripeptide--D-alanyl-D-alanine ligase [Chloroflexi bacterium]|nr:UDP-N-acetylmuramoyl-tripeptide--D-alanyl-D-alanine ligase [Chloroflexota bacterium]